MSRPEPGPASTRYLLFFRTVLAGALVLEALQAPDPVRALAWLRWTFPLYGGCALALWGWERFGRLHPRLAQGSFLLDLVLVASAVRFLSGPSTDFFVAFFLVVLSSTFLRKPALSFVLAGAACLAYAASGLSLGASLADPGRMMKLALLAVIAFFSTFMATYARQITAQAAAPYERRLAWLERLTLVGRALSGVLHEVKTPLGTILLGVENARSRLRKGEDPGGELSLIAAEAERASEIIANFLEFTRPAELALSPMRLSGAVDKALSAMRLRLEERGVALERPSPPDTKVLGSERHLVQVFANLLANAAQAMPSGGKLSVSQELVGALARVRIEDDGCGISSERLQALLDPDPAAPLTGEGYGLGLGVARWILQKHGGRLRLESPGPGLGAAATVELPVAQG